MSLLDLLQTPIGRKLAGRAAANDMVAAALAGLGRPGQIASGLYDVSTPEPGAVFEPPTFGPPDVFPLPQPIGPGGPEHWRSGRGEAFDQRYNPFQPIPSDRESWSWAHKRVSASPEPVQPDDFAAPAEWARFWAARDTWLRQNSDTLY